MESLAPYGGWPLGVECAWPPLGEVAGDEGPEPRPPSRPAPDQSAALPRVAAATTAEAVPA